ncbi:hypothetical protein HDV06_003248 [Boothiomyces sp. JEL0866]|nr:hypothetical protein HDV06_003248 [Boothiomyces sp. JEL0866]
MELMQANNPNTALWKSNSAIAGVQLLLVVCGLIDFGVYTINLYHGLILSLDRKVVGPAVIALVFSAIRLAYIPLFFMFIPADGIPIFPNIIYSVSFSILFVLYIALLIFPLLFAIGWSIKYRMWRNSGRLSSKIIVMPIYNEDKDALINAVESIVQSVYPANKMVVYLSFDSDEISDLYLHLMKYLAGGEELPKSAYRERVLIIYQRIHFIVNRFPHGGKRNTQAATFEQITDAYEGREKGTFVLFIDSDIILHRDCMLEFLRAMEDNKEMVGMTGFISAISSRGFNPYWYFQDTEYVIGQIFSRALEAGLGGVTCLPGALTIVRLKELAQASKLYFSDLNTEKIFDFHRYHLGEDRYLTHILMEQSKSYSIGFCLSARAKTEAPGNWTSFLKQRRRWLLGALSNEVYFLCDVRLWFRVPFLILYKLLLFSSQSTGFLMYLVLFSYIVGVSFTTAQTLVLWTPYLASWILTFFFAIVTRRFKIFWMYPILVLAIPWIFLLINLYSTFTWNVRTWGGPRTDQEEPTHRIDLSRPITLLELQLEGTSDFLLDMIDYDSSGSLGFTDSMYSKDSRDSDESGYESSLGDRRSRSRISLVNRSQSSFNSYRPSRPSSLGRNHSSSDEDENPYGLPQIATVSERLFTEWNR